MRSPNEAASIATLLIQKCSSTTSIRRARQLHALLLTSATAHLRCSYAFNNIVSMYARCGSLADSQLVFDNIPHRNIVSYNALVSSYSRTTRHASLAFRLFDQLLNENLRPNGSTFTSLLQASSTLKNVMLGSFLHAQCIKFGFMDNVRVQTSLLGLYSSCGVLELTQKVFHFMVDKDAMAWNTVIFGYLENGKMVEGLEIFSTMIRDGARPDQFTHSMVLNACGRLGDYDTGKRAHAHSLILGTCLDLPLHNALLDMYCSCGDTETAIRVFRRISNPDLVSWNTIIAGYSENGDGAKAMDMFVQLVHGFTRKPDEYTYAAVISATGAFPACNYGKPLHAQVQKAGLERSVYVGSTLISMYFSNAESESAQKIFSSVLEKDVVLWTDMVAGYSRIGDGETAVKFFHGMSQEGHEIDSYALSSGVSACADLATLRQGQMVHNLVVKKGYDTEMTVCGSLIDMYAKVGDVQAAEAIFSEVIMPDLKCWNSLLGGFSHHGKAEDAFQVFDCILKQGIKPDNVTFISVLSACSHCGLVERGKFYWNYMKVKGIKPGPKHYSCMITLFSRAGLLEEAEKLIIESPFANDYMVLWRTLLDSCVMNKNLKIGTHAAERVLSMDAEDAATNVLLAKLYAADGRWGGVAEMRRKIKIQMLEKDPGLSWTENLNDIHVFSSGDQSHPLNDEMRVEIQRLLKHSMYTEKSEI
ncbi:pentatricopeptide repeat-containing protein At3g50420 [Coffea arabica]|uniref:Pentatricopeptide repeat-containing protein At3g50420 n=1 Tax=Coffea arabica TaxID=13443 RepID=A0A6P6TK89_COFAR|nr:pentatricopeptide repeat-containing protein At3g50420 [Coffea arabica]